MHCTSPCHQECKRGKLGKKNSLETWCSDGAPWKLLRPLQRDLQAEHFGAWSNELMLMGVEKWGELLAGPQGHLSTLVVGAWWQSSPCPDPGWSGTLENTPSCIQQDRACKRLCKNVPLYSGRKGDGQDCSSVMSFMTPGPITCLVMWELAANFWLFLSLGDSVWEQVARPLSLRNLKCVSIQGTQHVLRSLMGNSAPPCPFHSPASAWEDLSKHGSCVWVPSFSLTRVW